MFVENLNFDQINDVDDFHLYSSDQVEIIGGSHPCTMNNMIQHSK